MDYEPITKGLRELMSYQALVGTDTFKSRVAADPDAFDAACDDIDAIHRSLEAENKEMFDFCDRLKAASEYRVDVTLYGVDYIPVPLDKDDVPIHIGDTLEWSDGTTFEVVGIGDGVLFYTENDEHAEWTGASTKHHHPDTWEHIIEDATKLGFTDPDNEHLRDKLVARCKALCERTKEGE